MKKLNCLERQFNKQMKELLAMDVAEIFSPERVVEFAKDYDLEPGWSLDLTTTDEEGRPWNFNDRHMRNKAARKVLQDKPMLLIGSPPCTYFSQLMRINWARMDPETAWQRWNEAVNHLNFCLQLYRLQMKEGRYFLHEHPLTATSWQLPTLKEILGKHGVISTYINMCAYGMTSSDEHGIGCVYKPTQFMTNSPAVAEQLARKCTNKDKNEQPHRHVHLINGRASKAQIYPKEL
eukprot:10948026-Karenia_brevis.AAC.1